MNSPRRSFRLSRAALKATAVILAILLIGLFAWKILAKVNERKEYEVGEHPTYESEDDQNGIMVGGEWYVFNRDLDTLLLIGLDKFEDEISDNETAYRNSQQSDFLIVLIINDSEKTFSLLHVNRDSMGPITMLGIGGRETGTFTGQLALSHTYGSGGKDSCENTVKAVRDYLYGIKIKHYMSFTMDAVGVFNDAVGGVTVTVQDDFSDVDPTLIMGETVTLYGDHALTYVRGRHNVSDQTNVNRMARQREYLKALYSQAESAFEKNSDLFTDTFFELTDYMVTDTTLNTLSDYADKLMKYEFLGIETIEGETSLEDDHIVFHADEELLQEQIVRIFYVPAE